MKLSELAEETGELCGGDAEICGLCTDSRVTVEGQELAGRSVRRIRALGVAHIPEDRLRTGCDPDGSIFDNLIALCFKAVILAP